jgi:hypothetical protein
VLRVPEAIARGRRGGAGNSGGGGGGGSGVVEFTAIRPLLGTSGTGTGSGSGGGSGERGGDSDTVEDWNLLSPSPRTGVNLATVLDVVLATVQTAVRMSGVEDSSVRRAQLGGNVRAVASGRSSSSRKQKRTPKPKQQQQQTPSKHANHQERREL